MDFSIKGPGAGFRFSRQGVPERRRNPSDSPQHQDAAPENAAFFAAELGEAEQMRAAVVAVNQAIEATEVALAWARAAASGLEDALAHARMMEKTGRDALGNPTAPPSASDWQALQERWKRHARAIDGVADKTRFGPFHLLDGSLGCRAAAFGPGLDLIGVGDNVRSSPPEGFEVVISQEPTRATMLGTYPLTSVLIDSKLRLAIAADNQRAEIETAPGQAKDTVVAALQEALHKVGLPVDVRLGPQDRLLVQHERLGSRFRFTVESSAPGVLSGSDGTPSLVSNGRDVAGTLQGEPAIGQGQVLTGHADNRATSGLRVRYQPRPDASSKGWKDSHLSVGRVLVSQQRLQLRWDGPEGVNLALRLDPVRCSELGRAEDDAGQYVCLADVTALPPERWAAALLTIGNAIRSLAAMATATREAADISLPRHLAVLRVQAQNLAAASLAITTPRLAMDAVRSLVGGLRYGGSKAVFAPNTVAPSALLRLLDGESDTEHRTKLN